jgi:hypothetical protein
MRQRYLLGSINRERYIEEYQLLTKKEQVYVQTTTYDRTFQSGFSELMGLFPPGSLTADEMLTQVQWEQLSQGGRGMPPMNIRNLVSINNDLGLNPLPNGFVSIPIYNHKEASPMDDINMSGCSYVNKVDGYTFPAESTYTSVDYLIDDLREPISEGFNLTAAETDSMTYMDLYDYCDIIQSRLFEGVTLNHTYTEDQMNEINATVLNTLVLPLSNPILSRTMYVSKQIRAFTDKARMIIYGDFADVPQAVKDTKYVIYSAHDWTVAQHLSFLDATNGNYTNVPFASQVNYELHSTKDCSDASCFWVEVRSNGVPQLFVENCADPARCSYSEFLALVDAKGYVHTTSHYEEECATPWTPPNHNKPTRFRR